MKPTGSEVERVRIYARMHWRDVLSMITCSVFVLGGVGMMLTEPSLKDMVMGAMGALFFGSLPVINGCLLLRRQTVAVIDRTGIELYDESNGGLRRRSRHASVAMSWKEIERVVLWHRSEEFRGIKYRETRIGVEPTATGRKVQPNQTGKEQIATSG